MAVVLHRLSRNEPDTNRQVLLNDLDAADRALTRAASSVQHTPEAGRWQELASTSESIHHDGARCDRAE